MMISLGMGHGYSQQRDLQGIRVRKGAETPPHATFTPLYFQQLLQATGVSASAQEIPRAQLIKWLGESAFREIQDLSREPDPKTFFHGQLEIARRLEDQDHLEAAQLLYSSLATQKDFPEIAKKAEGRWNALRGVGRVGPRLEFLFSRFAEGATEPSGLAAMVAGGTVFKLSRSLALGRLFASPTANLLTCGFGAEAAAGLFAFSLEVPAFSATAHGLHAMLNPELVKGWGSFSEEMASAFYVLGGMKLAGWGTGALFNRIHGINAAGAMTRLEGLTAFTRRVLPQAGMLGGLMLGHRMETWAGLRPPLDGATTLTDSLVTLLQFNVGGRLNEAALGRGFRRWELDLEARTALLSPHSAPLFKMPMWSAALAEGPSLPAGRERVEPGKNSILWMSNERDKLVPVKSGGSGVLAKPPPIPITPVYGLEDFPEIRKTLLPKTLKYLAASPHLAEDLLLYSDDLGKIDSTLGNSEIPGAVPYTARMLAEQMVKGQGPDLVLQEHPIAILVAASLATHYEELGDFVGQRIYRDLLTVYRLLREGPINKYTRAEEIILQNLELDPYNPWFIHLGLEVSLELGELAQQKPSHFIQLREDMEKLPDKGQRSVITKAIEKKLTDKNRKNYFRAVKEVGYVYAVLSGTLGFLGKVLSGIALGPSIFIKEIFYLQSLGGKVKRIPEFFRELKQRTSFEIQLYYGDYKNAVPLADKDSKLPAIWDLLVRQQLGEFFDKDIHLETIPQLHPINVRQTEALAQLKRNLSASPLVSLEGLPGSAKTYLAVQFAHELQAESERPVFWYTFKEGKKPDLTRFFNHLAYFLEMNNPETEIGLANKVRERPMLMGKLTQIRTALLRTPSVLFLDNFHLILEEEDAASVLQSLLSTPHAETKAVTISRRSHDSHHQIEAQVFHRDGMSLEEAESLFEIMGVQKKLKPEQMEAAFLHTRGRPMALILLGELLRNADLDRVTQLLGDLGQKTKAPQVLKYLFDQVYAGLPECQRDLFQFLTVFREPVPKSVLSFFDPAEEEDAFKGLVSLEEAFLVEEHQPGLYSVHEKYKRLTGLKMEDNRENHLRAAYYYWSKAYATSPSDYLEAGFHFFKAGEYDRAAKMLIGRIEVLLKKGYVGRISGLLGPLSEVTTLNAADRGALLLELGNYHHFKMEWDRALEDYKKSLSIQQGRKDLPAVATLYGKIGFTWESKGDWEKALLFYEKAAVLLKKLGDLKGQARAHGSMGLTYQSHQLWDKAEAQFRMILQLQKELDDKGGLAHTYYNLGLLERDRIRIPQALSYLKESLALYQETKNPEADSVKRLIGDLESP